jgi:ATP-dependent DNA ligase
MEGIVDKRKDSIYRLGKRTFDWLKIKARLQHEFVVGGFTEGRGSRKLPKLNLYKRVQRRSGTGLSDDQLPREIRQAQRASDFAGKQVRLLLIARAAERSDGRRRETLRCGRK